jgi:hypothetical protein
MVRADPVESGDDSCHWEMSDDEEEVRGCCEQSDLGAA